MVACLLLGGPAAARGHEKTTSSAGPKWSQSLNCCCLQPVSPVGLAARLGRPPWPAALPGSAQKQRPPDWPAGHRSVICLPAGRCPAAQAARRPSVRQRAEAAPAELVTGLPGLPDNRQRAAGLALPRGAQKQRLPGRTGPVQSVQCRRRPAACSWPGAARRRAKAAPAGLGPEARLPGEQRNLPPPPPITAQSPPLPGYLPLPPPLPLLRPSDCFRRRRSVPRPKPHIGPLSRACSIQLEGVIGIEPHSYHLRRRFALQPLVPQLASGSIFSIDQQFERNAPQRPVRQQDMLNVVSHRALPVRLKTKHPALPAVLFL